METWNSFLQTVFQFVKSLFVNVTKRMHRNAVVLTTGVAVVTVVTFTAGDFHGGGRNAMVAFAETPQATDETETELEETQTATELAAEPIVTEAVNQETAASEARKEESETESPETEAAENVPEDTKSEEAAGKRTEAGPGYEAFGGGTENTKADSTKKDEAGSAAHTGLKEVETSENEEKEPEDAEVFACSNSDYRVLLKIVQAEAGICDTKGRILVANVILNRVKSDQFPDSIPGVVYEKYQFSPVIDGSIDTCKVTQKTIDAVDRALAGEDYSQGALYFMNRRTSSKKNVRWFDSRLEYLFKHGDHEFFR